MMDKTLRWVATCLLILITLVFVHLGLAVISGQTNTLFETFLDTTWPRVAVDEAVASGAEAREELAFTILNYGITALGTAWVACFAYLIVMRNQQRQAEQQLSMERLRLTAELDESILEILDSDSVYEIDSAGKVARTKLLSACDRNTVWRGGADREWNYRDGERTTPFVETSKSVSASAEVGLTALHRYLGWIRRIVRAVETHVLLEKDVLLFWRWVVIGCYRNRYPFLCSIFFKDDLKDFVRLVDQIVLTGEKTGSGKDFVKYLRSVGDPSLISELSKEARAIVERGE
ncbi:hypothetical protein ACFOOP_12785 [Marinicaulis aureus]|uniref:Uncharacterized protein n=1 Tax=Hyphococcus aureus TaxID=2666033 RepID=A0ABW1L2K1_9PROT